MNWKNETEMFEEMKKHLYTPVVGDILDVMGYVHQFLPANIRPMTDDMKLAGKACTVLQYNIYGAQKKPFGLMTEALDQLEENEIYISTGATNSALWGEMLTATSKVRGATGAVVGGYHRDTPQILAQDFPVFSTGPWAQDSSVRTYVADFRCKIEIGQVTINDGDIVFGDVDGVVIIPKEISEEVIKKSFEKVSAEKEVLNAIQNGMSATDAFAKFGIL